MPITPTQTLSEAIQTGVCLPTRSILLTEVINEQSVRQVWTALQALDSKGADAIRVYVDSGGGSCSAGWAIYDMLRSSYCVIQTICIGKAYSMAALVMQAGDERWITKNSVLMLHPVGLYDLEESSLEDLGIELESAKKTYEGMVSVIARRMKIPVATYKARYRKNSYFSAREALAARLIDSII